MKFLIAAALLALTLPTMALEKPPTADEIMAARQAFIAKSGLFDPAPLFPEVWAASYEGIPVYCGMVNARNRMGGYVGPTPFIYLVGASLTGSYPGPTLVDDDDRRTHGYEFKLSIILKYCGDPQRIKVSFDPPQVIQ